MPPPSFLASSLYVAVGGGSGAWLRYIVGRAATRLLGPIAGSAFPWATLTCNVAGSFAMGVLVGWLARHDGSGAVGSPIGLIGGQAARLLLGLGLLGGFTTFSSFSMELVLLVERGQPAMAAIYAGVSLAAGFAGMVLGLAVMRAAG